jgi:acetyl-CoA C-acetyltransferase/acetyl-CoA acyltransferase
MTDFGVYTKPLSELFADAALPALDDAGISSSEVDALFFGNVLGGATENATHLAPKVAGHIGLPPETSVQRFEDACATGSLALKHAIRAVETGEHDVALVGGVERCTPQGTGIETPEMTRIFVSAADRQYEQPTGVTFPGVFALMTKRHMHRYGTTEEQLAEIAVKNHAHGKYNPRAHFGKDTSVEAVLDSPLVVDPFHLMDCCPFSDGGSAAVVVSDEYADSFDAPVDVTGLGHGTDLVPVSDKADPLATQAARDAAERAYGEAGITADDVDFAEVHDCFTGAEVLATEALGFVEDGEGGPAAAAGRTSLDGDMPINPSGGLKAKGHPIGATGTAQVVELTEQLRGETGDRQVADASVGLAHNLGGDTGSAFVTIMEERA